MRPKPIQFEATPSDHAVRTMFYDFQQRRGPDSDAETLGYFAEAVGKFTKTREDIKAWADLLDLDDYVTFGGKA